MSGMARLLAMLLLAASAPLHAEAVHEHRLANGMRVLVKEDHRAPVVVCMIWYRAGSMDEVTGTTGVAHVLEHMMFKGTKELAPGEFSRIISRAGGRENAFTTKDSTVYHEQLHRSQLPLAMRLEADRMANLLLSPEQFAAEIKVVMEERRLRTDDQPKALVYENFIATAYQAHPYRTPVIGWMSDLEGMRLEDARDWHRRWYAPNNATLVVVGDVSAAEVFAQAEKHFGPIAPRPLPARKALLEPVQHGVKRINVKTPADLPHLVMGWHVPSLRDVEHDWEPYALEMLVAVLAGSDAARLEHELVRTARAAIAASASYDSINRGPAMLTVSATPAPGTSVQQLEQALRDQLQRVAEQGVSEQELARAKAQVRASLVFDLDSMFSQAMQIGALDNAGLPYDSLELLAHKLTEVTSAQVQAMARRYLVDDNLTVAVLEPQPISARGGSPASLSEPDRSDSLR